MRDLKVEGNPQWVRKASNPGLVDNQSSRAYQDFIKARERIQKLEKLMEKLEGKEDE